MMPLLAVVCGKPRFANTYTTRKLLENKNALFIGNALSTTFQGESARLEDRPVESSYYLERASFFRLDNLTLSYQLPSIIESIEHLELYSTLTNVFTVTDYRGWDPDYRLQVYGDVFASGYEFRTTYPPTKSLVFGLKMRI